MCIEGITHVMNLRDLKLFLDLMKNRTSAPTAITNIKGTATMPLFWKALKTSSH